ncbi:MAG TPA: rod shape-determining protein MreC [Thermoanaerobaculaceae bacterium]|nr:rod shape-determining protein MreC [Thermoanaerobaculaceae bacterium]
MIRVRLRPDITIILVCAGLYVGSAAQVRTPAGTTALSLAATTLATPALTVANAAGEAWEDFRAGRRNLEATLAELGHLREESAALRRTNQLLAAEVAELRQGSALLAAYPSLADHAVLARVVARDVLRTHTLRLDRGSADGVRPDSAVLAEAGLLGRVDRVLEHSSRVQLLSHPAAAAAATVPGVGSEGLLVGGDSPHITGLPPYTKIAPDAHVLSTGSEGIYPPGMLFGTALEARTEGLFTVVPVQLAANPTDVTVVLVLAPITKAAP